MVSKTSDHAFLKKHHAIWYQYIVVFLSLLIVSEISCIWFDWLTFVGHLGCCSMFCWFQQEWVYLQYSSCHLHLLIINFRLSSLLSLVPSLLIRNGFICQYFYSTPYYRSHMFTITLTDYEEMDKHDIVYQLFFIALSCCGYDVWDTLM